VTKKRMESQGEIIDELRKVRAEVWVEYKRNPKQFVSETRKIIKKLGMRYGTPKKKGLDEAS
jgi:hypothetical protein